MQALGPGAEALPILPLTSRARLLGGMGLGRERISKSLMLFTPRSIQGPKTQ